MFTYFWEEARRRGQNENRQEKWPSIIQAEGGAGVGAGSLRAGSVQGERAPYGNFQEVVAPRS